MNSKIRRKIAINVLKASQRSYFLLLCKSCCLDWPPCSPLWRITLFVPPWPLSGEEGRKWRQADDKGAEKAGKAIPGPLRATDDGQELDFSSFQMNQLLYERKSNAANIKILLALARYGIRKEIVFFSAICVLTDGAKEYCPEEARGGEGSENGDERSKRKEEERQTNGGGRGGLRKREGGT